MRHTLEELKAMSDRDLKDVWHHGQFPFEKLNCGICLTEHASSTLNKWRLDTGCPHDELAEKVLHIHRWTGVPDVASLRGNLEELYALRLSYDSLYPPAETEASTEEVTAT